MYVLSALCAAGARKQQAVIPLSVAPRPFSYAGCRYTADTFINRSEQGHLRGVRTSATGAQPAGMDVRANDLFGCSRESSLSGARSARGSIDWSLRHNQLADVDAASVALSWPVRSLLAAAPWFTARGCLDEAWLHAYWCNLPQALALASSLSMLTHCR